MQTQPIASADARSWARWPVVVGVLLASVGFTWMVLSQSTINGRLAALPVFDDSSYLYDAAKRTETLHRSGWSGLAWELKAHPPHAPYSSLMAFTSFALFGRHDWAPYITNIVIVLVLAGYACRMMRSMPRLGPVIAVATILALPLTGWSVHEFRPDLACGLFTSILLIEIVSTLPERRSFFWSIGMGCLFGLCLLTKPSVFPVTGILTGSAMLLSLLRAWIDPTQSHRLAKAFGSCVVVGLVGLALWAPYMVVAYDHIIPYIVDNIFGPNREFWVMKGSFKEHLAFYLYGYGGMFAIGNFRVPFLLWMLAAGLLVGGGWRSGKRLTLIVLGMMLIISYILPTINEVKQPFFGAVFYFSFSFVALLSIACLVERFRSNRYVVTGLVLLSLGTLAFGLKDWRAPYINLGHEGEGAIVQREVYKIIAAHAKDGCRFSVTTSGWINGTTLAYSLCRDGVNLVDHREKWLIDDLAVHESIMKWSDIVITSESGTGLVDEQFPAAKKQKELLDLAQNLDEFTPIGEVATRSGKAFHIFAKTSYLASLPEEKRIVR
ncbi:glycosyltransferase family 39 protein [bacterium]|nr:glycosyltransferase family 39 protein [bacterium]